MSLADELQKLEELRRSGALNDQEFAQAKAALLSGASAAPAEPLGQHLADQLAEVRYQNELARVDREWEVERQNYVLTDRYGRQQVPSSGMAIGTAIVGGVFGLIWTVLAFSLTSLDSDFAPFGLIHVVFPLFGVGFIIAAVGFGFYAYARAQRYEQAFAAYQERRRQVRPEQFQ